MITAPSLKGLLVIVFFAGFAICGVPTIGNAQDFDKWVGNAKTKLKTLFQNPRRWMFV
jgi:hypothetical protein